MKTSHLLGLLAAALVAGACAQAPQPGDGTHAAAHDGANACASCHRADFESVTRPPHPGVKPLTCEVCHTQESWHPSVLHHEWPLTGAHAKVDCFGCHVGTPPVFHGTGKGCVDCHRSDAAKVGFAEHATFGTDCTKCHTTSAWKPATGPAHEEPEPEKPAAKTTTAPKEPPQISPESPAAPKTPPAKPRPKPAKPAPSASATPTKPPDVVTHPSRRLNSP